MVLYSVGVIYLEPPERQLARHSPSPPAPKAPLGLDLIRHQECAILLSPPSPRTQPICMCVCVCVCTCEYISLCVSACVCTCVYRGQRWGTWAYMPVRMCLCVCDMYVCVQVSLDVCVCIRVVCVCIYTYIFVCPYFLSLSLSLSLPPSARNDIYTRPQCPKETYFT